MKTTQTKPNPKRILGYLMAFAMMVFFTTNVNGQCTSNSSNYPSSGAVASSSSSVQISSCNYLSEYTNISGIVAGVSYTNDITMSGASTGYVTIVEGDGTTHHGAAPFTWTANASGSVTGYWNVDAACATAAGCHVTTITGNATVVPGCTDPLATNYNPAANTNDGSCTYSGCPLTTNAVTLPYSGLGLTNCGNGNNVTSANASVVGGTSYYLNGEEAVYEFAGSGMAVLVNLLSMTTYTGVWVYDDCPTTGGSVVAFSGSGGSNESCSFTSVVGTTYYVVIDTWASPTCIPSYDLSIADAVSGCMYVTACNYDSLATVDDGSCTYPGCTDPLAVNYSASAGCDDGSCMYSCTAAPYSENFDAGIGTFTNNGWTLDANGTGSSGTGPSDDITGGGNYMYYETSGAPPATITLTSECLDISALAAPALRFQYHMYGATMGTLDVSVNGASVWSLSGDQGNVWNPAQIDLSAFVGQDITVVFTGTKGSSYTGDMAIDAVEVDEMQVLVIPGCMDSLALNYNMNANVSDTSCLYPPTNDDCATAEAIACGASAVGNNTGASANSPSSGAAIWYSVTGQGGDITVSTCGTSFDTRLYVFDACGGTQVAYNDDAQCTPGTYSSTSTTTFTSVAGTVYSIAATGYSSSTTPGAINISVSCAAAPIPGCTDSTACNYNASANSDDGSCILPDGCTDSLASNYNALALCDDGSCTYPPVSSLCCNTSAYPSAPVAANPVGAVQISSCNYLSEYSTISGIGAGESYTCDIALGGVNLGWVSIYEGASCGTLVAEGPSPLTWTSINAGTHYAHWHVDSSCATAAGCHVTTITGNAAPTLGCTDPLATNYNPAANQDDGSCIYPAGCLLTTTAVTLPYLGLAETNCGNGNNINSTNASTAPLGTYYLNGEEGIYEFTATGTTDIIVDLVGNASYSAIFVYDACPTVGAPAPVATSGSSAQNENLSFTPVAGTTYYVVIDTWASPVCIPSYDLSISEAVMGCTNPLATNYNPAATTDDGSCILAGCTSGIGANSESFEDPAVALYGQGPWANWTYDAATSTFTGTNGWRKDNLGTGSSNTGPANGAASADGAYYLYCETSGQYNLVANLHSSCVDLSNFSAPNFVASVSMYGATMGTLNIDVSTDGGTVWNNEWTMTGDQGQPWFDAIVDLAAYSGQLVQVRMNYTSGTSFSGDCAIDNLRFMEAPASGCMDPLASNYDPNATIDDGSCLYPGCMDPMATNYCSTCNVNDSLSCIYPGCSILPFSDDFESGSLVTNDWLSSAGGDAHVALTSGAVGHPAALAGAISLEFAGGTSSNWGSTPTTEAAAFDAATKSAHFATANVCLDLSNNTGSVELTADVAMPGYYTSPYRWMRVTVNGSALASTGGFTAFSNSGAGGSGAVGATSQPIAWDLSAYVGMSSVNVTFETSCKYGPSYNTTYSDWVVVDDVNVQELSLCSYYAASATSTDVTCNGGSDGTATVSTSSGSGMDLYMWDNGGYTASISGLAAGTYTCITTDDNWGCMDTVTVVVGEPSAMSLSAVVVDESSALNDGSIDLSVSGGTPCITVSTSGHPLTGSTYASLQTRGYWFQAQSSTTISGVMCADGPAGSVHASSPNQSIEIVSFGTTMPAAFGAAGSPHTVLFSSIDAAYGWLSCNVNIVAGEYYAVMGSKHAAGGGSITNYNLYAPSGMYDIAGVSTQCERMVLQAPLSAGSPASGAYMSNGTGSISSVLLQTGVPGATAYTFAWDNGATTEDLSGLAGGTYGVTVTDCAGCTSTGSYTVAGYVAPSVPGCMDTTACNYDALATVDDGSCILPDGCTDPTALNYDSLALCDDGSCIAIIYGCTDPTACNYYAGANADDGSCEWTSCAPPTSCGGVTGVNLTDVIHDRVQFNWDDMNDSSCVVDQIRIQYSDDGGATYSLKTMGAPVGNNAPCLNTSKLVLNLTPSTVYVYDFKIWYQDGTVVNWHAGGTFTTADVCVNATNMTATPTSSSQTDFCWTNPASHEFVRLQYRENVPGSSFSNIGGFGVMAPAACKTKNGLTAGTQYRVMWRTWCNVTGGPYRSPVWDGPVIWDQPSSIRVEGGTTINHLDVYPNPSRDIFNVTFTSEDAQDLDVRVINVVGEVVYTENLEQFVGEYTKAIDLATYTKGIYFLEITTNNGVVNKKLILQ